MRSGLAKIGAGICLVILAYAMAALLGGLIAMSPNAPERGDHTTTIRLLPGPIHYDLLLPNTAQTRAQLGWLEAQGIALSHPDVDWIIVGWGAREFYTTTGTYRDVTAGAIWRGLTGDAAVMRISVAAALDPTARTYPMPLTDKQYAALLDTIVHSFANGAQTASLATPGFSDFDRFFPAKGRFHVFNTCNVWIGNVLRRAGVRFGAWTPTPYAVTLSQGLYGP